MLSILTINLGSAVMMTCVDGSPNDTNSGRWGLKSGVVGHVIQKSPNATVNKRKIAWVDLKILLSNEDA